MGDVRSPQDWAEVLTRLDQNVVSAQLSPDVATLTELMDVDTIPGISVAAGDEDGQIWAGGYGVVRGSTATPLGPHTALQACSISKHVTAFGAMRLVDDGVLDLDADIHNYLTSWRLPHSGGWQAVVTARQLLAHTAGLTGCWFRGYGADEATPTLLQTLHGQPPANTPPVRSTLLPGSRFRYSGSHYAVLQQLMMDVTGAPFDELLRVLVLDPVGMVDSSFDQEFPHRRPEAIAFGHHQAATPVPGGWRRIPEMAGAGLWTTPTDLVRLECEIARAATGRSRLLSQGLAEEMLSPQVPGGFGLGTEVRSVPTRRFGHTGGNVGYVCFSFAWPDAGEAVAVMANSDDAREVLYSILAAAERRYAATASDASDRREPNGHVEDTGLDVTGRYLLRDGYAIDVALADDRLTFTVTGQTPAVLPALPDGSYRLPGLDLQVRFPSPRNGESQVMELWQENAVQIATRQP
jgi:CubicO group peptidase (beta-lactamase class C family)